MYYSSDILKIRESTLYNKNVKENVSIVGIGDIHISNLVGMDDINRISEVLYNTKADYICMLGDIIDSPEILENEQKTKELEMLIHNSSLIAPTMIVLGGHDFVDERQGCYEDILKTTKIWNNIGKIPNVHLLNDRVYTDNKIVICGYHQKSDVYYNLSNEKKEDVKSFYEDFKLNTKLYRELPSKKPKVLLTHSPEPIYELQNESFVSKYDIILTAHYHNGCVPAILDDIYPENAGIITPSRRLFPKQARGIIKLNNGPYLIYNGGWVKISECTPKIFHPLDKLCNRQLDIVTLTSNETYQKEQVKERKLLLKNTQIIGMVRQ